MVAHACSVQEGVVETEVAGFAYPGCSVACAVQVVIHLDVVFFATGAKDAQGEGGQQV